jgi:hypothetical protein
MARPGSRRPNAHGRPTVLGRLIASLSLFTVAYLGAAVALSAGWVTMFVLALCVSQSAAVGLFLYRPGTLRARMQRDATCPLATAAAPCPTMTTERARAWIITGAVVDEARHILPVPPSEPAGGETGETNADDSLTFWGLVDSESQTAVEVLRSRVEAEMILAEAIGRSPGRRHTLSVAAIDLGALSSDALERAGVRAGVAFAGPADALGRALATATFRVRGQG